MPSQPAFFDNQPIRRIYDEATDTWWFSVVDIVKVLTDQSDPTTARKYWNKLKQRLKEEGSQLVTNCHQLKLPAEDGKQRLTDCATAETLLRLVQSVPSPKAEPIKLWLAKVGYERMQELADPSLSLDRARETYKKQGRSDKWIAQRMTGQETRNNLTDYWANNDVKPGQEFAILTNLIHEEWTGVSVQQHKNLKGLKSHNLRDHMTEAELIFTRWPSSPPARSPRPATPKAWPPTRRPPAPAAASPSAPASNSKPPPAAASSPATTTFLPHALRRSSRSPAWLDTAKQGGRKRWTVAGCRRHPKHCTTHMGVYVTQRRTSHTRYHQAMPPHFTSETTRFLRGLKRNNDREWFEARRDVYERALRQPMLALVDEISKAMEVFAPEHVRPANKIVMRIYRDTRFSKNKLPYKTHMAAWWARRGMEKTSGGGFYLQVGVDGVLAASGCYMPEREQLLAIRRWMSARHLDYRAETAKLMRSKTLGFSGIDAAALTRMPKGFAADDPADQLLRAKSWGVHSELPSALALSPTLAAEVVKRFKASSALVGMLNAAIVGGGTGESAGDELKARRPLF